jgi:hypothetical protein
LPGGHATFSASDGDVLGRVGMASPRPGSDGCPGAARVFGPCAPGCGRIGSGPFSSDGSKLDDQAVARLWRALAPIEVEPLRRQLPVVPSEEDREECEREERRVLQSEAAMALVSKTNTHPYSSVPDLDQSTLSIPSSSAIAVDRGPRHS